MQGMRFLVLDKNGIPINHGIIAQAITPERYLCRFAATPVVSRVVRLEELETYNLFPDDKEMNAFIDAIKKADPPPAESEPKKKTIQKRSKK